MATQVDTTISSEATVERQKHFHEICFSPNTRSNTLANVPGQFTASSATIPLSKCLTRSQRAMSRLVLSFRTSPTAMKNFQTTPPTTPPAANCPDGELMKFVIVVKGSGIHLLGCGGRHAARKAMPRDEGQ